MTRRNDGPTKKKIVREKADKVEGKAGPQGGEATALAVLKFTDLADGTMRIDASHSGDFDPAFQSHACLRALTQFLPELCAPAGTHVDGARGVKLPVSDAERYQAMRALALIPEDEREQLLDRLSDREPENEAEFDLLADQIVALCRGKGEKRGTPELLSVSGERLQ